MPRNWHECTQKTAKLSSLKLDTASMRNIDDSMANRRIRVGTQKERKKTP